MSALDYEEVDMGMREEIRAALSEHGPMKVRELIAHVPSAQDARHLGGNLNKMQRQGFLERTAHGAWRLTEKRGARHSDRTKRGQQVPIPGRVHSTSKDERAARRAKKDEFGFPVDAKPFAANEHKTPPEQPDGAGTAPGPAPAGADADSPPAAGAIEAGPTPQAPGATERAGAACPSRSPVPTIEALEAAMETARGRAAAEAMEEALATAAYHAREAAYLAYRELSAYAKRLGDPKLAALMHKVEALRNVVDELEEVLP